MPARAWPSPVVDSAKAATKPAGERAARKSWRCLSAATPEDAEPVEHRDDEGLVAMGAQLRTYLRDQPVDESPRLDPLPALRIGQGAAEAHQGGGSASLTKCRLLDQRDRSATDGLLDRHRDQRADQTRVAECFVGGQAHVGQTDPTVGYRGEAARK